MTIVTDQEGNQVAKIVRWRNIVVGQKGWGSLSRVERRKGWKPRGLPILGWGTGFKAGDIMSDWGGRDILAGLLDLGLGNRLRDVVWGKRGTEGTLSQGMVLLVLRWGTTGNLSQGTARG